MAIFRGVGGSGDSSDNSFLQEVTGQANAASASASAASASASAASASATSALNTELTSASFNTSDGVLTLTKQDGETVTADLDGRFLTSYTETNNLSSAVTWADVPNANITVGSVTQHQAALSITESQISNLGSYLTASDITGKANLSGATFTGDVLFNDGVKAKFGTDSDLLIYHNNGEPSIIEDAGELGFLLKTNGNVFGVVTDTNENMILAQPNGTVSLYFNNEQKLATSNNGITVTGTVNGVDLSTVVTTTNASFDDDVKLKFGASDDLLIYHDTTGTDTSVIEDAGTNGLHLISDGNGIFFESPAQHIISAHVPIGGVTFAELYYNNSSRFRTTDDGVSVTGDIAVSGTVDGRDVAADGTKLDNIEANATADQTGAEIKSAYEAVADTNAYTDAEKSKLSGIEASADVTDTANVTAAGALMDSEVTNLAQVKAFDSSDYATAAQGTTATNALPKSGGEVTGNITGFIDIRNFYSSLNHQMGSSQSLTTTFTTVGADSQYTHSGLGTKTIDVSLDILYYNVSYTNDAELRFVMTAPNPATESTVNLGNVVAIGNVSGYQTNVEVSGDFTKHFSNYMGLANSSDGTNSLGVIYKYYYDGANDRTIIQINSQASLPSVGSPIYLHPFDWESSGTDVISAVYQVDFTTDSTVLTRRDYNEHLGYFTSSVAVKTQMRESTTSENVTINEMRGKLTRVGN